MHGKYWWAATLPDGALDLQVIDVDEYWGRPSRIETEAQMLLQAAREWKQIMDSWEGLDGK